MKKIFFLLYTFIVAFILLGISTANAANRFSVATGNWNSTSTWSATSGGASGASVPVAGDAVTIEGSFTVTVTANAACTSVTFTTATQTTTLSINSGITLAVSGAVTIPRSTTSGINTLAVGAGTLTAGSIAFTSGGGTKRHELTISTGTVTVSGDITETGSTGSATITFTGAGKLQLGGAIFTNATGTLTTATSCMVEYTASAAQSIGDYTYEKLKLSGNNTKSLTAATIVTDSLIIGSGVTFSTSGSNFGLTLNGNYVNNGGTFTGGSAAVTIGGTGTTSIGTISTTGTVTVTKTGGTATLAGAMTAGALTMNGTGGTLNLGTALTDSVTGAVTLTAGTLNGGSSTLKVGGAWTGTATFTAGTGTVSFSSAAAQTLPTTATTFNNLTVASANTKTLGSATVVGGTLTINSGVTLNTSGTSNFGLTLNGDFTKNGTFTGNASAITIGGTATQSIAAFTTTGTVTMSKTGGTATLAGAMSGGALTINGSGGTLNLGTSLTHSVTGVTLTAGTLNGGSSTLQVSGTWSGTTGFTANTGTVNYNGTGAQTIAAVNYNNLTISGARTTNSVTLASSGTIGVAGTLSATATFTSGGYIVTGSTVNYNGSSQSIPATPATYNNLTVTQSSGGATLGGSLTVNGTLNLSSGTVTTSSNTLTVASTGSVSRTTGYVVGNLKKSVAINATSASFEVGTSSSYMPVSLSMTGVSVAGTLTAKVTSGDHASISTSGLNSSKSVNDYWTLTNTGITLTSYSPTFTFTASDYDGGSSTGSFIVKNYNGSAWSSTTAGTRGATSTQATGVTTYGDFAIGEQQTYTITASAGSNGSISPSGSVVVNLGADTTFTITANSNYHVADVLVDASSIGAVTSKTFTNVTANHTISASFAITTYTITASAGSNGSISPSGSVVVNSGTDTTFTIAANTNYHIADVLVDASSIGAVSSKTFTNVTANHTISASFAITTYTITASATGKTAVNGTISPSGAVVVNSGSDTTFTISPNTNYHIADVLVDASSIGAVTSKTFTNVTADHTIEAQFAITTYTITASAGSNGSISPSGSVVVNSGTDTTFTITADANYRVLAVLVDGDSVGAITSKTFTNVTANHTISASFELNVYTITASAGSNGSISPSGSVSILAGTDTTFTITADANYHVADVMVDASSIGTVTSKTFTNVTANHTISASFAIDQFAITASAGANGSVTPSGATNVNYGDSLAYTIAANTNYHIDSVFVDVSYAGAISSYTFTNVTATHTISASFAIDTYTITASASSNGSISPSGTVTVNAGTDTTFTITADVNYHIVNVLVDASSIGAVSSKTFTNVTANHTISASFAITTYTITASATGKIPVGHGTISPSGVVVINSGSDTTFTMSPSSNFHVADVLVDGSSIGAVSTKTFTNVTANHTIAVNFKAYTTTVLTSSVNPSALTQPVVLKAKVDMSVSKSKVKLNTDGEHTTNANNALNGVVANPTGSVEFYDGTTLLGTQTISGDSAKLTVSNLSVGSHNITAKYLGDISFEVSTSGTVVQVVNAMSFSVSPSNVSFGNVFTFSNKQDSVTVTNNGASTLSISAVTTHNASLTVTPSTANISASGSQKFYFTFAPTSTGAINDTVAFTHNAYGTPGTLVVTGTGIAYPAAATSGNALSFNGTSSSVTATSGNMNVTSAITVEGWIKTTSATAGVVTRAQGAANSWKLDVLSGKVRFDIFKDSVNYGAVASTLSVNDGQWHHIAGVFDGTRVTVYVDGTANGSNPFVGSVNASSASLKIGNDASTTGRFLNGQIDEVRIWNVAKTQSQIQNTMFSSVASNASALVSYWRFDEGTGTTTADISGGKTGTLANTTWVTPSTTPVGPAQFSASPSSVAFGNTVMGVKTDSVTITNTGFTSLVISNVASDNSAFSVTPSTATIATQASQKFYITFMPTSTSAVNGNIVFTHNTTGSPSSVGVSGTGIFQSNSAAGNALTLDGTNDYVAADTTNLNVTTALTVEAWMKTSGTNAFSGIVTKGQSSTGSWKLNVGAGGTLRFDVFNASTYGTEPSTTTTLADGQWHHVAGVYDGTILKTYVDGVLNGSAGFTGAIRQTNSLVEIGNDPSAASRFFNGQIDEVRIWNVAKTQSQIQSNRFAPLQGNESGLVSYYRFDENSGLLTGDGSGNGHNGVLTNGAACNAPTATAPVGAAQFSVSPTSVAFGSVAMGIKMDSVTVTNTGYASLSISNVASDNSAFIVTPSSATIATQATQKFYITFRPTSTSAVNGNIVFTHNASGSPSSLAVSGTGMFQKYADAGNDLTFSGVKDRVDIDTSNMNVTTALTVEAWIKTSGTNSYSGIVTKSQSATGSWKLVMGTGGTLRFDVFNASTYGTEGSTTTTLTDGQWHHVAGVYDGTTLKTYVDGVLNGSAGFTGAIRQTSSLVEIGNDPSAGLRFFNGQIDEVRIWNVARTQTQVQNSRNASLLGNDAGLVAYYRFSEGYGTMTGDASGNGHNATLTNSPAWTASTAPVGATHFSASPSSISFGTVLVGIKTDSVTITNTGYEQLSISGVTSTNAAYLVTPTTATISTGASQKFYITYSPTNTSTQSGSILFTSNASSSPDSVTVSGTGMFQKQTTAGNALAFDGSDVTGSTGNLGVTNALTVEAWFKIDAAGTNAYSGIATRSELASLNQNSWKLTMHGTDKVRFDVFNASAYQARATVTTLSNDVWYHIAGTYDGSMLRIYLNGVCEDSVALAGGVRSSTAKLMIGNDQSVKNRFFTGQIDEVRIWNIARSASEIATYKDSSLAGNESGLVSYYRFDEGYRSSTGDGSGNGNTGTLVNNPTWVSSTAFAVSKARVNGTSNEVPTTFSLLQNYPNPFNPSTTIRYELPEDAFVSLKVYDLLGNEVSTLESQQKQAGAYDVKFDASKLSSGVYFYKIVAGRFVATKKLLLMK